MSNTNSVSDNQWNDYWNNDGAKGEVFVGADGSAHPELSDWWQSQFSTLESPADIVDLACGAGSVFTHLPVDHAHRLFGADISADALELMRARVPGVTTTVCSASDLPYSTGQFDVVCSQFGVEYAGVSAFAEAARVLKKGGDLRILCHIEDGFIDSRNRAHLERAMLVTDSRFIPASQALTAASFGNSKTELEQAAAAFVPAERQLAQACKELTEGIHLHLYTGFRQLYQNRNQYAESDIQSWLEHMSEDVSKNVSRLKHMREAASDKATMASVVAQLEEMGCAHVSCAPLQLKKHHAPVAWALTARR